MHNFKKAAISFSIDDGLKDSFRLYKLLSEYSVPATFNIITSRIGDEGFLSLEELRQIHSDPIMEIACHSHTHINTDRDILSANRILTDWLGEPPLGLWGFASPGSDMTRGFVEENGERLRSLGLLYVRSADNPNPDARQIHIAEDLSQRGEDPLVVKNIPRLVGSLPSMFIPSVVMHHKDPTDAIQKLVSISADCGLGMVIMLHSVRKPDEKGYDSTWSYDYEKTEELIRYIKEQELAGKLTAVTTRDFYNERKQA